ncbi:NtaA/DmoA family FMN-dependent monooxygenase [Amycolatopsis sp. A1MSW2902]|uniref:NtaA/DmoA family FMN-dependent monooxygenase n=1 Tax=Amycolatopsis sp. A1MSW2902 TaxID=687413 RepID=UPI00307E2E27
MPAPIILNYILGTQGYPWEAWRHPDSRIDRVTDLDFYLEQARIAERGRFDTLFLVDHLSLFPTPDAPLFWTLDPMQLMTALATHTEYIGFIATVGTSFASPYQTARRLATLDHLSRGRAGWNIVTSGSETEGLNHGLTSAVDREARYRRACEFLDACLQLWHAWEVDALPADRAQETPVDVTKISAINYQGQEVSVKGPLGTPRSPQTVPILCQAGPSPSAREIAGAYADLVYARHEGIAESREYRDNLRECAHAAGRGRDAIRLIPNVVPFIGSTEAEARRFHDELMDLATPAARLADIAGTLGISLDPADLRQTVPPEYVAQAERHWPWVTTTEAARWPPADETITWAQLVRAVDSAHQHTVLVGTPEHIADRLATGWEQGAYDGLSIAAPLIPAGLADFVDTVVPILQDRGAHKRDYPPGTLRERLRLPISQHVDRSRWTPHYPTPTD